MTVDDFLKYAVDPAMEMLPGVMDSPEARRLLVAIALQESRLIYRHQLKGPAHGFYQFEPVGVDGVLSHHASRNYANAIMARMNVGDAYAAIEYNDILATAFARLALWRLPEPIAHDVDSGWRQYREVWRPGKPKKDTWAGFYARATM